MTETKSDPWVGLRPENAAAAEVLVKAVASLTDKQAALLLEVLRMPAERWERLARFAGPAPVPADLPFGSSGLPARAAEPPPCRGPKLRAIADICRTIAGEG